MKVLFVGEGPHDIGPGQVPGDARSAQGVIPTLARKVCPTISPDSVALEWTDIRRFHPQAKRKGFESKVSAAVLLATRKFNCSASVLVADQDSGARKKGARKKGTFSLTRPVGNRPPQSA